MSGASPPPRRVRSLEPEYFEAMFRADDDPWRFRTSAYEAAKYRHTLDALAGERAAEALEVGCANGVLTRDLAGLCDRLVSLDVSATALRAARAHCADRPNVTFEARSFPGGVADLGAFDLIVLSEVAYYLDDADLARAGDWLTRALTPGGRLLLVHWTDPTDYPQTGDEAVEKLHTRLGAVTHVLIHERRPTYRLDLWRRR